VLAAPEAVSAILLPPLLGRLRRAAPGVLLAVNNVVGRFESLYEALDRREIDVALLPLGDAPARFLSRELFAEDFVVVTRRGHPLGAAPTLARYCAAEHLVVSLAGELHGLVDDLLRQRGLARRVVLAVPSFMLALAIVEQSDLVAALPRRFVATWAPRFAVRIARPPLKLSGAAIHAIAPRAAFEDAGLAWLVDELAATSRTPSLPSPRRGGRARGAAPSSARAAAGRR
jgi:DNA-binding transcriptional LysR family regulator